MDKLKSKYKREQFELIKTLVENDRSTVVLELKVLETSKIREHLIYQCIYLHAGKLCETHIIAKDIIDAMHRLEPYISSGTPEAAINYLLGKEKWSE